MFMAQETAKDDFCFLIARVLAGDKSAMMEYKNLLDLTADPQSQEIYKMAALALFDEPTCQQIFAECQLD